MRTYDPCCGTWRSSCYLHPSASSATEGLSGGCSFCALTFHQGRIIQTRSHQSLLDEARQITKEKDFKGYIHDVGERPTSNFRHPSCKKQLSTVSARTARYHAFLILAKIPIVLPLDVQFFRHVVHIDGQHLAHAALLHRHAVEHVGGLHRAAAVGDDDELRLVADAARVRVPRG